MEETLVADLAARPFGRAVLHERARFALDDPEGEKEALWPLTEAQALRVWNATQPEDRRPGNAELAAALNIPEGRDHGRIPCPAHGEGKKGSLSYRISGDRLLIHCFAGCTFDEIRRAALGAKG